MPKATPSLSPVQRKIYGLGYQLSDLVDPTGLTFATISRVVSGKQRWANAQLLISQAVGTTPPALFGDLCHPSLRRPPVNSRAGGREHDATHPPRTAEVAA